MINPLIAAVLADKNISPAFRNAMQMAFRPADFRQLTRRETEDIGAGLSADVSEYMAGGREVR